MIYNGELRYIFNSRKRSARIFCTYITAAFLDKKYSLMAVFEITADYREDRQA